MLSVSYLGGGLNMPVCDAWLNTVWANTVSQAAQRDPAIPRPQSLLALVARSSTLLQPPFSSFLAIFSPGQDYLPKDGTVADRT